jgi:hypothetical protein
LESTKSTSDQRRDFVIGWTVWFSALFILVWTVLAFPVLREGFLVPWLVWMAVVAFSIGVSYATALLGWAFIGNLTKRGEGMD